MDYFNNQMMQQQQYITKMSRGQIVDCLNNFVYQQTGIPVTKVEKLPEMPQTLKHSCVSTGITNLPQYTFSYMQPDGMMTLPFFFCDKCGKLYYCPEYLM